MPSKAIDVEMEAFEVGLVVSRLRRESVVHQDRDARAVELPERSGYADGLDPSENESLDHGQTALNDERPIAKDRSAVVGVRSAALLMLDPGWYCLKRRPGAIISCKLPRVQVIFSTVALSLARLGRLGRRIEQGGWAPDRHRRYHKERVPFASI
jgi:hypothetical protein